MSGSEIKVIVTRPLKIKYLVYKNTTDTHNLLYKHYVKLNFFLLTITYYITLYWQV